MKDAAPWRGEVIVYTDGQRRVNEPFLLGKRKLNKKPPACSTVTLRPWDCAPISSPEGTWGEELWEQPGASHGVQDGLQGTYASLSSPAAGVSTGFV